MYTIKPEPPDVKSKVPDKRANVIARVVGLTASILKTEASVEQLT